MQRRLHGTWLRQSVYMVAPCAVIRIHATKAKRLKVLVGCRE